MRLKRGRRVKMSVNAGVTFQRGSSESDSKFRQKRGLKIEDKGQQVSSQGGFFFIYIFKNLPYLCRNERGGASPANTTRHTFKTRRTREKQRAAFV